MTTSTSGTYRADKPTSEALMMRNASLNRASMKMAPTSVTIQKLVPSRFAVTKLNPGFFLPCATCSGSLMPRASTATANKAGAQANHRTVRTLSA
jgi:hypothetical protein